MTDAETPPTRIDLRPSLPPVRDQGERGTCLAFAVTAAHEVRRLATAAVLEDLAEEILYWGCKQLEPGVPAGTTFRAAAAALDLWGQPAEELWPYDGDRDETAPDYAPPTGALDSAVCHTATLQRIPARWDEITRALADGRTVALGIFVGASFYWTTDGRITLPASEDELEDGHAVLIVGYEQDHTLIFRNSWGTSWGNQGYGYLPYAYLERFGGQVWVVDAVRHGPV